MAWENRGETSLNRLIKHKLPSYFPLNLRLWLFDFQAFDFEPEHEERNLLAGAYYSTPADHDYIIVLINASGLYVESVDLVRLGRILTHHVHFLGCEQAFELTIVFQFQWHNRGTNVELSINHKGENCEIFVI